MINVNRSRSDNTLEKGNEKQDNRVKGSNSSNNNGSSNNNNINKGRRNDNKDSKNNDNNNDRNNNKNNYKNNDSNSNRYNTVNCKVKSRCIINVGNENDINNGNISDSDKKNRQKVTNQHLRNAREQNNEKTINKEIKKKLENKQEKGIIKIGYININGINITSTIDLEEECKDHELEIIGITETHLRNKSKWDGTHYRLEAKGREKRNKKEGGVALMINKHNDWETEEIDLGNSDDQEDMLVWSVTNKKLKIKQFIIICVYMTTGNKNEIIQENRRKYNIIKTVIKENKEKSILIMGDMNAHIGILGEKINKNGELLLAFTEENYLEIGNITMAKGKVTWSRKGGKEKSAIDFIIMNDHMKSRMQEKIIDEEKEIDLKSDHNMIITKLKIKEQGNTRNIIQANKKWKRKNVDWIKYKEEIGKARSITGRSKEEKMNNIHKVLRWVGERSVGYTKGTRKNNYRP